MWKYLVVLKWPLVGVVLLLVGAIYFVGAIDLWLRHQRPPCEYITVVEIVKVNYRTVTLRLADGQLVDANQPTVAPGDKWCVVK